MDGSRSLTVLMPVVEGQRWSCHSCGDCCRTLVGHVTEAERRRLDEQDWEGEIGAAAHVRSGRGWALNKRPDGACVFLDDRNRCRIHSKFGESAKPLACRIFPFSVRATARGWQASLRFDCPSVTGSKGEPLGQHRRFLAELVNELAPERPGDDRVDLQRGVRATAEELAVVGQRLRRWLERNDRPIWDRLIGAARWTATLEGAKLRRVRGERFSELLDLLLEALPGECEAPLPPPTGKQSAMLRQYAFAHAEHVTLGEITSGLWSRIRKRRDQLSAARRFLAGKGVVPALPGFSGTVDFVEVETVVGASDRATDVEDLVRRYLTARMEGGSVYGAGFYGWPVFRGLAACWLSMAAAGWLARYRAATQGRKELKFEDVAMALGVVDRAATRLPVLGTLAERARVGYLQSDDGVARLLERYRVVKA